MEYVEVEKCVGKTVGSVFFGTYDGCLLQFTDGTWTCISISGYWDSFHLTNDRVEATNALPEHLRVLIGVLTLEEIEQKNQEVAESRRRNGLTPEEREREDYERLKAKFECGDQ